MSLTDVYQMVGVSPENPVNFKAEFHVVAKFRRDRFGADGGIDAFMRDDLGTGAQFLDTRNTSTIDSTLSFEYTRYPGQPFRLIFDLGSGACWGSFTTNAQITFTGLPAGASMVSCQGFLVDGPVPVPVSVQSGTWGRLRAWYR